MKDDGCVCLDVAGGNSKDNKVPKDISPSGHFPGEFFFFFALFDSSHYVCMYMYVIAQREKAEKKLLIFLSFLSDDNYRIINQVI